jgi:type II secretory pathway pseudopilin PulG
MMKFMNKSKKGVTLVESVFAVVILGILTIGILSLLGTGGAKIMQISGESNAHSQAVQKMDLVISAISNGSTNYITKSPTVSLDVQELTKTLFPDDYENVTLHVDSALYETGEETNSNFRGWYLKLTYKGATVTGFASNSEGAFDKG